MSLDTDSPTKERMASTTTAMPISSVNSVSSSGSTFGNTSRSRVREGDSPMTRAEVT